MNDFLTVFTPALIALAVYLVTSFFPPKLGNAFLAIHPAWWSRDEQTWARAYKELSKGYVILTIVLIIACTISYLFQEPNAIFVTFLILIFGMIGVHFLGRKKMAKYKDLK